MTLNFPRAREKGPGATRSGRTERVRRTLSAELEAGQREPVLDPAVDLLCPCSFVEPREQKKIRKEKAPLAFLLRLKEKCPKGRIGIYGGRL